MQKVVLVDADSHCARRSSHNLQPVFQVAALLRPNCFSTFIAEKDIGFPGHYHTVSHQC